MARAETWITPDGAVRRAAVNRRFLERPTETLLISPTRAAASRRARELLTQDPASPNGRPRVPGLWGARVMTFEDFATRILESVDRGARRASPARRRLILEGAVAEYAHDQTAHAADTPDGFAVPGPENRGFVTHLERLITGLKQAAIEPEDFAERVRARRRANPLDDAAAAIYARYQDAMKAAHLYDRQGLYWLSHACCLHGRPPALDGAAALLLDGFDDFTPAEFRLIVSASAHFESIVFAFNHDGANHDDGGLVDAAIAKTIQELGAELVELPSSPPHSQAGFAARCLFTPTPPAPPEDLRADIVLTAFPGATEEIEAIARRVKALILDDGVPPHRIAVVFPDLAAAAPVARTVFAEAGVPLDTIHEPPLAGTAVGGFVSALLEALTMWARDPVADVLQSPFMAPGLRESGLPGGGAGLETASVLAREGGITSGKGEWQSCLAQLERRIANGRAGALEGPAALPFPNAPARVAALRQAAGWLADLGAQWPAEASLSEHAHAVEALLQTCGVAPAVAALPSAEQQASEATAFRALLGLLGEFQTMERADLPVQRMDRSGFAAYFNRALRETGGGAAARRRGGVACMDPEAIRPLSFSHVFFAGVNEGALPRSAPLNAIYSENDLHELAQAGVVLEPAHVRRERERIVFRRVFDAAETRIHVSWHTASRDGQERLPSPFIGDLQDLLPDLTPAEAEAVSADPVPGPEEAVSLDGLRNAAFAIPRWAGLREMFADECAAAAHGAAVEAARYSQDGFGPYDGVLTDPAIHADLSDRYSGEHVFSVSQLETYARCPFSFFMERILRVHEVRAPEAMLDQRLRGVMLHEILRRFHQERADRLVTEPPDDAARQRMAELAEAVFEAEAWRNITAPPGVMRAELAHIKAQLQRYLTIMAGWETAPWRPTHFEASFGYTDGDAGDASELAEPFELRDADNGESLLLAGRIDRIDAGEDGVRIIDYKSGAPPQPADMDAGVSLQLPLYALAVSEYVVPGQPCAEALFIPVGKNRIVNALKPGPKKGGMAPQDRTEQARFHAFEHAGHIREGLFPPTPYKGLCFACQTRRACRYEEHRIHMKQRAAVEADEVEGP